MANGVKTYQIVINGVQESINAVESLNKQLGLLESKINALSSKAVNISSSSGGGGSRSGALSEEEKLQKQIAQTEEKRIAYQKELYQTLLAEKDLLKETVNDQKQVAAQERLTADAYSNTMDGMKQKLADIKAVMQTVDLGDTDTFSKLTKEANELNEKLLEIEKSYGQFGRNVGNYASAAEGFKGLKITVGDTVMEFDNARQALKALKQEMQTLQVKKDQGLLSEEEVKRFESLVPTVKQLESSIQDAGKPMDNLLDTMQSFVGLAQAGKGISAFFGLEGTGVDETIKNLVALQNAMQGLQTIQKQLQTGEGLGKYFTNANTAIDNFTKKIFGVKDVSKEAAVAAKEQAAATSNIANASKAATSAEVVQTTTTAGLTVGMRVATVAARALGVALKAIGIGILLEAVSWAIEGIKSLGSSIANAFDTASKQVEILNMEFEALQRNYSYLIEENNRLYSQGSLSYMDYMTNQLQIQNDYISKQIELQRELDAINGNDNKLHWYTIAGSQGTKFGERIGQGTTFAVRDFLDDFSYTVDNLDEAKKAFEELNTAVKNGNDYWSEYGSGLEDWYHSLTLTVNDTREEMYKVGEGIAYDLVGRIEEASEEYKEAMEDLRNGVDGASDRVENAKKKIEDLEREMNTDDVTNSVIANLPNIIPDEETRKKVQSIIDIIKALKAEMNADEAKVKKYFEDLAISMLPEAERAIARINQNRQADINEYGRDAEKIAQINAYYDQQIQEETDKHNNAMSSKQSDYARKVRAAQEDLNDWLIKNMENGLQKQLAQLNKEKNQKIAKVVADGILVQERITQIENYYTKKRQELTAEHTRNVENAYRQMWQNIYSYTISTSKKMYDVFKLNIENQLRDIQTNMNTFLNQNVQSYVDLSPTLEGQFDETLLNDVKKYIDLMRKAQIQENLYVNSLVMASGATMQNRAALDAFVEKMKSNYDAAKKEMQDYEAQIIQTHSRASVEVAKQALIETNYANNILTVYRQRFTAMQTYWQQRLNLVKQSLDEEYQLQIQMETERYADEIRKNEDWQRQQLQLIKKNLDDGLITQHQYEEAKLRIEDEYIEKAALLTEESESKKREIIQKSRDSLKTFNTEYYNSQLQDLRDFNTAIANEERKQPVINVWGVTNLSKTNAQNKKILDSYKEQINQVMAMKKDLQNAFSGGLINQSDFEQISRELDSLIEMTGEKIGEVQDRLKLSNQVGQIIQDLQQYIQVIGQSIQTIMSAYNDYQNYLFDKQQEYLDKQNEILQDKLDKQEEILQKHSDAVNDIEDELSSARGDRRQHLIDQLNAEIQAQREAAAEKKEIEKQQEALQKKQDELDKQRKKAEYKRNLASILVQGAMAVSSGLATTPFVPVGIAMGALAASLTAYQYALAAKQKPYAKGGVLEGPSHREGGIPVGNTGIEVEGQEYVIRKKSTRENVPVLDFINKSERKLTLDDFIDFYSSKPRATIKNIKSKFADGGVIPSTSSLDISEQLQNIVINQDNRPIYVSVVDINNKQADVRRVQALAGL